MDAERYIGAASVSEFAVQASFPEERSKLGGSFHLRNNFDCRNQALISCLRPLLLDGLVLFVVIRAFCLWKFPSDQKLVAVISISPSIPLVSTLVQDAGNFIQKFCGLGLQYFGDFNEVVYSRDHKDNVDSMARDHDFK